MSEIEPQENEIRAGYERLHARWHGPLQVLVALAALATIPVIVAQERGDTRAWVAISDWAIWVAFLAELVLMGLCASNRPRYFKRSWLGLLIVVLSFPALPDVLAYVRLARVARVVRVVRLVRVLAVTVRAMLAMRTSLAGQSVIYVGILTALLTVGGGALLTVLEPETLPGGFWDGLWWAVVTVTTVGYGDVTPLTLGGKLLAVMLMLCGLGMLSTLAASISALFIGSEEQPQIDELRERLNRIEEKLDRVLAGKEGAE